MNLAFRVDSSNLIGAGHLRRCLKLAEDLRYKCDKIIFITQDLKNNFNKDNYINKVNVDVLKNKILKKEKKTKLQNRVILGSVIVSVGIIGYFVT